MTKTEALELVDKLTQATDEYVELPRYEAEIILTKLLKYLIEKTDD